MNASNTVNNLEQRTRGRKFTSKKEIRIIAKS